MLTRLYIDNFRCFVNFEYRPERKQLILGANGTGKSSLMDALRVVNHIAVGGTLVEETGVRQQRTRWVQRTTQRFELEAVLAAGTYVYALELESGGDPVSSYIAKESLHLDSTPLLVFESGQVSLRGATSDSSATFPLEPNRSSLFTVLTQPPYALLTAFRDWLSSVYYFRINPYSMLPISEREERGLRVDMSNFASWYRAATLAYPREHLEYITQLREVIDGFDIFRMLAKADDASGVLIADFKTEEQGRFSLRLNELSEGQKCLVCLYAIQYFILNRGRTVFIDEPDNFVSLREIQPWLNALSDAVDEGSSQAILISHHPELLNQWAPAYGVELFRDRNGPVRVRKFQGDVESPLAPAELIARGWHNG